jgi:hypothetical protein
MIIEDYIKNNHLEDGQSRRRRNYLLQNLKIAKKKYVKVGKKTLKKKPKLLLNGHLLKILILSICMTLIL